jgi:hypothetical protein
MASVRDYNTDYERRTSSPILHASHYENASDGEFGESLTSRVDQKVMTRIEKSENHT